MKNYLNDVYLKISHLQVIIRSPFPELELDLVADFVHGRRPKFLSLAPGHALGPLEHALEKSQVLNGTGAGKRNGRAGIGVLEGGEVGAG